MDAYSNDSYYKNEIVYVHIPNGDFSKQKHIVGRKVDIEKAPNRTFNLRMPFDDFVGIEKLTEQTPYIFGKRGYLANYPKHGNNYIFDQDYLDAVAEISAQISTCDRQFYSNLNGLNYLYLQFLDELNTDNLLNTYNIKLVGGSRIRNVIAESTKTFYDVLVESVEAKSIENFRDYLQNYASLQGSVAKDISAEIGQTDYDDLIKYINLACEKETVLLQTAYQADRDIYVKQAQEITDNFAEGNYNLLWSWRNTSSTPLVETMLGISADFQTLIGSYRPIRGLYGLRILISGILRQPEENQPSYHTEEIIWNNEEMYGNTYAYATPYTQQKVLDVSNFLSLTGIDIYFYQDDSHYVNDIADHFLLDNFMDEQHQLIPYDDDDHRLLPKNIYVDNLQVFLGLTTSQCNTDRVLLYTYDSTQYGEDPFNENSRDQVDKRTIQISWIHKMKDGSMVLVDHAKKRNEHDNAALECYDAEIHWYHYVFEIPQDTTIIEQRQGGVNWEYLAYEYVDDVKEETVWVNDEPETVEVPYHAYTKFAIDVTPDIAKAKEKWKVIVSVGGVPYISEPLIFYNYDQTVEQAELESVNEVVFRILRETIDEKTGKKMLKEDNSLDQFLVYDENGNCLKNDDNLKWSQIWFYIQVWIRNNEDGGYTPIALSIDEDNWDTYTTSIEWLLPGINSMLYNILEPTDQDLANAELAPTTENISEGFRTAIRLSTRKFQIRDHWNLRYTDNTIAARIVRNGRSYNIQKKFEFGQSGTMGSEYSVAIVQDLPERDYMIQGEEFRVRAVVYDSRGNRVNNSNFVFSWELLSPTKITPGKNNPYEESTAQELFEQIQYGSDTAGNHNNVITGFIRNEYPPVFRVTIRNAADYPLTQTVGFSLVNQVYVDSCDFIVNCPNKIEFKSDGKVPITITSPFEIIRIADGYTKIEHCDWGLEQYVLDDDVYVQVQDSDIRCVGLKQTTYQDESIVTNNNPVIYCYVMNDEIDFDSSFSLENDGIHTVAYFYTNVKNAINQDYADKISELYDQDTVDLDAESALLITKNNRIRELNRIVQNLIPQYTEYALDPYIGYTPGRDVPWQWDDSLEDDYYTILYFTNTDNLNGQAYYKQAIPFTRNVYSSSLVNSWNGSLTLDEQNGAVLATMISAGAKDSKNRFTGVMMGDWAEKADNSLDVPGLYGLKYGEQVFGFKTDGTGFIGASGKGRIEFDGNKSLISNNDRTCYINLDPIIYTLDTNNQVARLNNYSGFSQYFLYAQTKKTSNGNYLGEDKLEASTSWAYDFMQDTTNDYFIVDPNNGILTTGGIIARYGKIGNWMISNLGLYQKKSDGLTYTDNRYMYLGFSALTDEEQAIIDAKYGTKYANLENRYSMMIRSARSKFRMEEFKVIGQYKKDIFNVDPIHFFNYAWPVYDIIQALQDTLDWVDDNPEYTTNELINTLKERVGYYIYEQTYSGYHRHYSHGVMENGTPYTGGTSVYGYCITNLSVTNDSYSGQTLQIVANTNRQPEGHHFAVFWTSSTNNTSLMSRYNNFFGTPGSQGASQNPPYYTSAEVTAHQWANCYTEYGAKTATCSRLNTNLGEQYNNVEVYQETLDWLTAYYNYHLEAYLDQLDMMIAEGLKDLTAEQRAIYDAAKAENERQLQLYIKNVVDPIYNSYKSAFDTAKNKDIQEFLDASYENRYAIFAGYQYDHDPLFSVNWRGYMTARAGKIGDSAPWYITDHGLTQTSEYEQRDNSNLLIRKIYSTIFLGNPDAPANKADWTDLAGDTDQLTLLPNHNEDDSPLVWGASDLPNAPTRGRFAIYAGGPGYERNWNPSTNTWTREWVNTGKIKFGVRPDGTLYSTQGEIGKWKISNMSLSSYDDNIILDSNNSQIVLGMGRTILYGNGKIKLINSDDNGNTARACIELADYQLSADTTTHSASNLQVLSAISTGSSGGGGDGNITSFDVNWHYSGVHSGQSYTYTWNTATAITGESSSTIGTLSEPNIFSIWEQGLNNAGVNLVTGKLDSTIIGAILYPHNVTNGYATLGTPGSPWNLYANSIQGGNARLNSLYLDQDELYLGGEKAATQEWVINKLKDLVDNVLSNANSDAGETAEKAQNGVHNVWNKLAGAFDGPYFIHSYSFGTNIGSGEKLVLWRTYSTFNFGAIADGGNTASINVRNTTLEKQSLGGEVIINGFDGGASGKVADGSSVSSTDSIKSSLGTLITASSKSVTKIDTLTMNGKNIKLQLGNANGTCGDAAEQSLNHSHDFNFDFSGGVVSLTIGDANFNSATSGPKTFNVAATRWYDDQIQTAKVEASNAALSGVYVGFSDGKAIAYSEGGSALDSKSYPTSSVSVSLVKGDSTIPITSGYTIPSSAVGYTITF